MRTEITYQTETGERCIPLIVTAPVNWAAVRQMAQRDGALDMAEVERQITDAKAAIA